MRLTTALAEGDGRTPSLASIRRQREKARAGAVQPMNDTIDADSAELLVAEFGHRARRAAVPTLETAQEPESAGIPSSAEHRRDMLPPRQTIQTLFVASKDLRIERGAFDDRHAVLQQIVGRGGDELRRQTEQGRVDCGEVPDIRGDREVLERARQRRMKTLGPAHETGEPEILGGEDRLGASAPQPAETDDGDAAGSHRAHDLIAAISPFFAIVGLKPRECAASRPAGADPGPAP